MNARTLRTLVLWHMGTVAPGSAILYTVAALLLGSGVERMLFPRYGDTWGAVPVTIFSALLGVALASSPAMTRSVHSLLLFSAPLYGRELARGLAVAPCALALTFPLGVLGARLLSGTPGDTLGWNVAPLAAIVASLVALSATLRDGWRAALYRALALGCGLLFATLPFAAPNLRAGLALALAAGLGFLALRAFGETLARYDPIS